LSDFFTREPLYCACADLLQLAGAQTSGFVNSAKERTWSTGFAFEAEPVFFRASYLMMFGLISA
jgi:hypothetical protein